MNLDRALRAAPIAVACLTLAAAPSTRPATARAPAPEGGGGEPPYAAHAAAMLDTLAQTERSFSALSGESGMKDAFLFYLAKDGLVYRRGFVNGRKSWKDRPNPAGTLRWSPTYAEVSGNADLGWTTGPWEFKPHDGSASAYGTFITVWERPIEWTKPEDQVWRVAIDTGISHEKPKLDVAEAVMEHGPAHEPLSLVRQSSGGFSVGMMGGGFGFGVGTGGHESSADLRWQDMQHATNDLLQKDREYAYTLRTRGAVEAVGRFASEDVRFLRDGGETSIGKMEAIQALGNRRDRDGAPLGSKIATSFDIGCSWGLTITKQAPRDTSAYLRVWRYEPGRAWVLIADVENPFSSK